MDEREQRVRFNFAHVLETACREFECLNLTFAKVVQITAPDLRMKEVSAATIRITLAKAFLFNSTRAYRICQHGKRNLYLARNQREDFLKKIEPAITVRDVNEHGYDAIDVPGKKNNRPRVRKISGLEVEMDETCLFYGGPECIMLGTINLYDLYVAISQMRNIAGYESLMYLNRFLPNFARLL